MPRRAQQKNDSCGSCNTKVLIRSSSSSNVNSRCIECDSIIIGASKFNHCEICGLETKHYLESKQRIESTNQTSKKFQENVSQNNSVNLSIQEPFSSTLKVEDEIVDLSSVDIETIVNSVSLNTENSTVDLADISKIK